MAHTRRPQDILRTMELSPQQNLRDEKGDPAVTFAVDVASMA